MKHKLLAAMLALVFGFSFALAACGETPETPADDTQTGQETPDGGGSGTDGEGSDTDGEGSDTDGEGSDTEEEGYASVSYKVAENEVYSAGAEYTPLEIFGRLNYTFKQKTEWYMQYQGTVIPTQMTFMTQDVQTLKQYKDGVLLSTDISKSMMLNTAKEFCYLPAADRVMWREATSSTASKFDGFKTPWKDVLVQNTEGATVGDMKISGADGFKETNGLPAYELSVYVFREETVTSADEVVANGDGTFKITYHLDPTVTTADDGSVTGAAAYYIKQMAFTSGGMSAGAVFSEITVSFTFNEKWETLKTEISEAYSTATGIAGDQPCTATSTSDYFYKEADRPFDACNDYVDFFKQFVEEA